MSVSVLLFASFADAFGARELDVPVESPCSISAIVDAMRSLPGGHVLPERPVVAVNRRWIRDFGHTVQPMDEVAVVPPVAGG